MIVFFVFGKKGGNKMKEHTYLAGIMTTERTNELFDKMLAWICEHIREEDELFRVLHDKFGFTKVEANHCGIDDINHLYDNMPVIRRFNEKIQTRFNEYKSYWRTFTNEELIEHCEEIYTVTRLAQKLPNQITPEQAEYFLQFVDPLDVISGTMIENRMANDISVDEEIADTVESLKFSGDGESIYEIENELPTPTQTM